MLDGQTFTAAALLPMLHGSDRLELEAAIEAIIAELDQRDGDADIEPNGDEMDASYPEGRDARASVLSGRLTGLEDAEEDDEPEVDDEPEDDGTAEAEPDREGMTYPEYHDRQPDTLVHPMAYDDQEPDEQEIWNAHRRRIRQTRCRHTPTAPHPYQLKDRNGWRVIKGGWA